MQCQIMVVRARDILRLELNEIRVCTDIVVIYQVSCYGRATNMIFFGSRGCELALFWLQSIMESMQLFINKKKT